MAVDLHGVTTVLLPGTGSDDDYLRRAFGEPLRRAGATLVAVAPRPQHLVAGYLAALEDASAAGPVAVGGVSLGAAIGFGAHWFFRSASGLAFGIGLSAVSCVTCYVSLKAARRPPDGGSAAPCTT